MRSLALIACIVPMLTTNVRAQQSAAVVQRPRLEANADTNSALEYFGYGAKFLFKKPKDAADAFYWASRIDPRYAGPIYGRYLAWFRIGRNARDYSRREKNIEENGERKLVDSLLLTAMLRDPFVRTSVEQYIQSKNFGGVTPFDLHNARTPLERARLFMLNGNYDQAAQLLTVIVSRDSTDIAGYIGRANARYNLAEYDSAAADLARAIAVIARRQDDKLLLFYVSTAMLEYARGHALLMAKNLAQAREAYGRALSEDLSFYMAHAMLAAVAGVERDTATAVSEYETAVQVNGNDPVLRYDYGQMLLAYGKLDEAAEQFRKAKEIEPYYPAPYLALAVIEDANGNDAETKALLEQFVARSPRDDPALERVRRKILALGAAKP